MIVIPTTERPDKKLNLTIQNHMTDNLPSTAASSASPPISTVEGEYQGDIISARRFSNNAELDGKFLRVHVRFRMPGAAEIAQLIDKGELVEAGKRIEEGIARDKKTQQREKNILSTIAKNIAKWDTKSEPSQFGHWVIEAGYDFGGTVDGGPGPQGEFIDIWWEIPDDKAVEFAVREVPIAKAQSGRRGPQLTNKVPDDVWKKISKAFFQ